METDSEFVNLRRFNYSINQVIDRYPEGAPTRIIAQALAVSEEEVETLWKSVVSKLRGSMGVDE